MQAIEFNLKAGNSKVIQVEKPTPSCDEVLVQVVFAAIDTAIGQVLRRDFQGHFLHSTKPPMILGWHFSGVIEAVGNDVHNFSSGDEVWGHLQYESTQAQGSFSEYITVKTDACAKKPPSVSHSEAAATSTEAMTALQAMRDDGGLEKGMSLLVIGAGGAVGVAAVQIGKQLGAHVTAVCSSKDVELLARLGADEIIDRTANDPLQHSRLFDVIFDTPCVYAPTSCLGLLESGGTYVTTLPSFSLTIGKVLTLLGPKAVKMVECRSKRKDLETVGKWLENGSMKTPIDSTFKVRDMKDAVKRYSSKEKKGRVVIEVLDGF